jgi:hypothetical protein
MSAKLLLLAVLTALLAACGDSPPPPLPAGGPDDATAPAANRAYRPVMAGTAWHGVGDRP